MGASTDYRVFNYNDKAKIKSEWDAEVNQSKNEDGCSYSGQIGMLGSIGSWKNLKFSTQEQAGDALFEGKTLFAGYGIRTDKEAYGTICKVLEVDNLVLCQLVDDYFYHLDTCFCPLGNGHAIIYPKAFSSTSLERMSKEIELHEIPEKDAKKFACNAVVIDNQVIIPSGCDETRRILESLGMVVFDVDMDQFILAGGACKCLTIKI